MAGFRSGRTGRGLISGLIVGIVGLASVGLNTDFSAPPRYDGAGYAVLGLALSTGQGYREIHTPGRERHTHYPPGYPLMLAGLWKVTGRSVEAAHAFSVACTVGAILAAWRWFGTMYRPGIALAAGLSLAVNWTWGRVGGSILSEPAYLLLGQCAILCGLRTSRRGGVGRGLALGVLLGACVLTRHVGATLAAAIGLELLLRGRRGTALAAGASASLVVLPWVGWLAASRRPTQVGLIAGEPLTGLVARQFLFYVRRIPDQWIAPVVEIGTVFANSTALFVLVNAWAFAATGLIGWGWSRALRSPRRRLAASIPMATFPLLLVWPFTEAGRFLIPLVPCLIAGAIEGLTPIAARLGLRSPRAWAACAVLAASIPYPAYSLITGRAESQRKAEHAFDEASDWIARHGDRPGPILTTHAAEVFWATGRAGLAPESEDPEDIARSIDRLGAAFLIVDENRYARAPTSPLERYVREHPERVRRAWSRESGGTAISVYEVVPTLENRIDPTPGSPFGDEENPGSRVDFTEQGRRDQAGGLLNLFNGEVDGPVAYRHGGLFETGNASPVLIEIQADFFSRERFLEVRRTDDGEDATGSQDVGTARRDDHGSRLTAASATGIGGPEDPARSQWHHSSSALQAGQSP